MGENRTLLVPAEYVGVTEVTSTDSGTRLETYKRQWLGR